MADGLRSDFASTPQITSIWVNIKPLIHTAYSCTDRAAAKRVLAFRLSRHIGGFRFLGHPEVASYVISQEHQRQLVFFVQRALFWPFQHSSLHYSHLYPPVVLTLKFFWYN
ncbi:hypothetical protein N0M98_21955 [Paenibacillus doosanensis]|uniref:hypothetical protein n=1 Tax=Paenibacillus konkukensis TaxID=2020716 RepID=UPI00201DD232|nr:hypothetical protein [Paenibacillus konkukensis]MCS7462792.1 hypothetical protein [Paenibacillus doosanensis]